MLSSKSGKMVRLKKTDVVVDANALHKLRNTFLERHCVVLRGLIDPELLRFIQRRFECEKWREHVLPHGIGKELAFEDVPTLSLLTFLVNSPVFIDTVGYICATSVGWFLGHVYCFLPSSGHYDAWHDDAVSGRLIGMSINLSSRAYEGGLFQIRMAKSKEVLCSIANTGYGDAILFRIASDLQHQVTEVTGAESKMAFAGWFRAGPMLFECLKQPPHAPA